MELPIIIYTDGAALGNPGPGGYGAVLMHAQFRKELSGGFRRTTNNRMELLAVIMALKHIKKPGLPIQIYTDSKYVIDGITSWINGWKKNGWRTSDKKPVKNDDLWKALDELAQQHQIKWHWVKGHAGHAGNERADQLANRGVESVS